MILSICSKTDKILAQNLQKSAFDDLKDTKIESSIADFSNLTFYLIESENTINASNLSKNGFTLHRKLSSQKAIVSIADRQRFLLMKNKAEYQYYTIHDNWKISQNLNEHGENDQIKVWVTILDDYKFQQYLSAFKMIDILIHRNQFYQLSIPTSLINDLTAQSFVTYISLSEISPQAEAIVLDLNLHPNRINAVHYFYPELNGMGHIMGIKEPFYDIEDIDISDRYISSGLESNVITAHPLQMATIMVGKGNSFVTGKGVAIEAFHSSSTNQNLIPDEDTYYQQSDIYVQNHSYGTQIESFYGVEAHLYDQNVYDLENVLHVFSAGNSGMEVAEDGLYQNLEGFANLTGNFKQSKNTLSVGAIDTANQIIVLNSNGPAYDGRIKPEIMAYSMAGSSNAAALVSGTVLLMQQYYKEIYGSMPSASLLKGILINSADDLHLKGPDYKTAYGQLNALKAIQTIKENRFIVDEVAENESKDFVIQIPEGAINFKATLSWTDLPANPNDEIALVNDLDLSIRNSVGEVFLPWVLDANPNLTALNSPAKRGEDHLNNVEQVWIENPQSSELILSISAQDLVSNFQSFSISYEWEMPDQFLWTSPTGSDNIPYNGATVSHLRWHSSFPEGTLGALYFKSPIYQDWQLIKTGIDLSDEHFRWDAPIMQDIAQLRMKVEGESYRSDTFTLSAPVQLKTGYNCADSLSVYWNGLPKATHYKINHLVNGQMVNLAITQDTTYSIAKSLLQSNYLQLIPYLNDQALIQSFSIDYNLQGSSCYLNSFFTEAVQDSGVVAHINLSAVNGVEELILERRVGAQWLKINTQRPEALNIEILDKDAITGYNDYRVTLNFNNGASILSEVSSVYFVRESEYKVFPNPVAQTEDLLIFTKETEVPAVIHILSASGRLIFTHNLEGNRNYIDLNQFDEGLYFYQIFKDQIIKQSGKILIQF